MKSPNNTTVSIITASSTVHCGILLLNLLSLGLMSKEILKFQGKKLNKRTNLVQYLFGYEGALPQSLKCNAHFPWSGMTNFRRIIRETEDSFPLFIDSYYGVICTEELQFSKSSFTSVLLSMEVYSPKFIFFVLVKLGVFMSMLTDDPGISVLFLLSTIFQEK